MNDENQQPSNPLGEATDPAAVVEEAVKDADPTESSDPSPENAAEPIDGSAPVESTEGQGTE